MNKKLLLLAGILALGATSFAANATTTTDTTGAVAITGQEGDTAAAKAEVEAVDASATDLRLTGSFYQKMKVASKEEGPGTSSTEYAQLVTGGKVNLTKKWTVGMESTRLIDFPGRDLKTSKDGEFETWVSYNQGNLFNSDLTLSHKLDFDQTGDKEGTYYYQASFGFAKYIGATSASLDLKAAHTRYDGAYHANDKGSSTLSMSWDLVGDVNTWGKISTKAKLYANMEKDNDSKFTKNRKLTSKKIGGTGYLFYDINLWKTSATTLAFHTEGSLNHNKGLNARKDNAIGDGETTHSTNFSTETFLKLSHNFTPSVTSFAKTGVTTSKDLHKNDNKMGKGYGPQGYVQIGFSAKF